MSGQRPPNELVTSHPAAFFPDSDREAVKDAGRKNMHRPPRLDIADVFARDTVNGVGQPGSLSEAVGQDGWIPISTADPPTEMHSEEDEDLGEDPGWIKGALIGEGAFGQVYLGMNTVTGLLMAVKQARIPDDSMLDARRLKAKLAALEHEINLLQDLRHTNIVGYLRSAFDEEHLNIFLEYVPGGSVASLLSSYGAFEETLVQNFLRQILRGLEYLHAKEIIHCDIKGANVLVDNNGHIKLSDFGISKRSDAGENTVGSIVRTTHVRACSLCQ
jgi:serine/threonine protein kinase